MVNECGEVLMHDSFALRSTFFKEMSFFFILHKWHMSACVVAGYLNIYLNYIGIHV